jgi:hypothetical protein
MSVDTAISEALLGRLEAMVLSPPLPVAFPGRAFDPPDDVMWLKAALLPAEPQGIGRDSTNSNVHRGLLQVNVFYPADTAEIQAIVIADQVIAHFAYGTEVLEGGFLVEVSRAPWRSASVEDKPWQMIPVRIPYQCVAGNPS